MRSCVRSQEGFEVKCPVYVREVYPHTLQSHPDQRPQITTWPIHSIANLSLTGGSTIVRKMLVLSKGQLWHGRLNYDIFSLTIRLGLPKCYYVQLVFRLSSRF